MAVNKVVFGNNTLIDLTSDTIQADKLLEGYTAHDASGANIVGTYQGGTPSGYTVNVIASSQELYGQTIDVYSEDVKLTEIYFSNVGTASIVFQNVGVYEFRVTISEITYKSTVTVTDNIHTYNTTIRFYPKGSTITPLNDIQTWLHCADIWDKDYTTLSQVLNDLDTLVALMASNNAVDYLVRSTAWAVVPLIPAMTSANTPSGVVSASSNLSNYYPYLAFDGVSSTQWIPNINSSSTGSGYIDYEFPSPVVAVCFSIEGGGSANFTCKLQGLNGGGSWDDLSSNLSVTSSTYSHIVYFDNSTAYSKYRLQVNKTSTGEWLRIGSIQLYSQSIVISENAMKAIGASDYASETLLNNLIWLTCINNSEYKDYVINASVPIMTSNTTPSGVASASAIVSATYDAYKAFDENSSTWWSSNTYSNQYVQYDFGEVIKLCASDIYPYYSSGAYLNVKHYAIEMSDDGVTWNTAFDETLPNTNISSTGKFSLFVACSGRYARCYVFDTYDNRNAAICKLQFYGRKNSGVQTLLHLAGIVNKNYTSISQLLADTETFALVVKNHDAVDYLVSCKGWIDEITSDEDSMYAIGQSNYCANTLLNDEDWLDAIANSTYIDSVMNVKTPVMTDYTTPSGEVIYSSSSTLGYPLWRAFDDNRNTEALFGQISNQYIGYHFTESANIKVVKIYKPSNSDRPITSQVDLDVSNNGTTWTKIKTLGNVINGDNVYVISNNDSYEYYRVSNISGSGSMAPSINEMQFYGRKNIPEPTPTQRQTNYYPFSSQTLIGGSNLAYGGVSFSSFKLSSRDLEEIQEIKIKGRLYISRGSTQMKKCRMDYTIAGEKNGKWCFWNGASWDITDVNITDRYGDGFYDARGWVNVKEIDSKVATVKSELIDLTIPISTIVASAKSNGINLEFANTFLNTAYWYGNFVEILGDSCFSLGIFAGRFANSTNAFAYYGFSVDQVNTTSDDLDTVYELANNSPQVEIEWK